MCVSFAELPESLSVFSSQRSICRNQMTTWTGRRERTGNAQSHRTGACASVLWFFFSSIIIIVNAPRCATCTGHSRTRMNVLLVWLFKTKKKGVEVVVCIFLFYYKSRNGHAGESVLGVSLRRMFVYQSSAIGTSPKKDAELYVVEWCAAPPNWAGTSRNSRFLHLLLLWSWQSPYFFFPLVLRGVGGGSWVVNLFKEGKWNS